MHSTSVSDCGSIGYRTPKERVKGIFKVTLKSHFPIE